MITEDMERAAVQAMKLLEDEATADPENIFGADLTSLARAAITAALAAMWQPIETAPRDGTHILIAFGEDAVAQGVYTRDDSDPHPWKFIDQQQKGVPIFNGARDDNYGPTHWMPLPPAPTLLSTRMGSEKTAESGHSDSTRERE